MNPKRLPTPARVPASHVIRWLATGWQLFMRAPAVWVIQTLIFIAVSFALGIVPVLGAAVVLLAFPVFCAGMIHGCETLQRGEPLELEHLFAGLRRNTTNLFVLGGSYLMGAGVIVMTAMLVGSSGALVGYLIGNLGGLGAVLGGVVLAGFIGYALWILLIMALWFAPALVMLGGVAPLEALIVSVRACGRNLPAFALMGLVLYVLGSLAVMTAMIGMLVLMPVIAGAVYASYRDVFGQEFAQLLTAAKDDGATR